MERPVLYEESHYKEAYDNEFKEIPSDICFPRKLVTGNFLVTCWKACSADRHPLAHANSAESSSTIPVPCKKSLGDPIETYSL